MERKLRYVWWTVLVGLIILAIWKLFLPHGDNAYLQKTVSNREIVVYVSGAVEKPGLVHLAADARVDDALKQVQLLAEADLDGINPAEKLKDGQRVSVPFKAVSATAGSSTTGNGQDGASANPAAVTTAAPVTSATTDGGKININTAGVAELDKLSGVGPVLAERILQYRTEHGMFAKTEDLQNVSGIGTKTYEKMASQVTVGP